MDRKQTVIAISVAMAFMVGWYFLVGYVERTYGPADVGKQNQTATNAPAVPPAAPGTQPTTGATAGPTTSQMTAAMSGMQVISVADSKLPVQVNLGSGERDNEQFALMLRTTAAGAGLDSVVLNRFLKSVDDPKREPYVFQHADPAVLQQFGNALATRSITVDGQGVNVSAVNWTLERQDQQSATYSIILGTPGQPVLKVFKTFRVYERNSTEHPGGGYEVRLDYDFENLAGRPLQVGMGYNGPAIPPRELDNGPDQRVMAGYRVGPTIEVENHYVESFYDEDTTRELSVNEDKLPAYWVGGSSIYFQGIIMPPLLDTNGTKTPSVASFRGVGLDPEKGDRQPLALVADTAVMTLAAGQRLNYPIYVYFGPKHRQVLEQPFYAALPRDYDQTLVVRAGPCAMCTFDWLINLLVMMLGAFHMIVRDWGLAIIALVVLVRLLLHPITKRSQVSMMKLGKMGPEIERLRKKHGDNKEELQKAMWEVQKQQGITPVLGCLPMFLQMPIWIALWSALNTTFELRHSNFLWGFTWINDLAKPDRLVPLGMSFKIPLIGYVDAFNILPILLAFVFYLQMKMQPKPPTMTKEQEQQQKIMQTMMVFLFPLFLYSQPSGLNLYILASTGIGIWESKRIRKHIKEKEEAEKAGVVIVDPEPPAPVSGKGGKGGKKDNRPGGGGKGGKGAAQEAPTPTGWLARKLAEFQKKAEELQRETERKRGRDRA